MPDPERSELLNFEEAVQKRLACKLGEKMVEPIGGWYEVAAQNTNDFYRSVLEDPRQAVKQIPDFIMKARDAAGPGSSSYECLVGGANYDWTGPVLDVVGIIYPDLPADVRLEALKHVLGFIDKQNYFIAQENVAMINEPWLVGDIILNRNLYWYGYKEYIDLIAQNPTWKELYPHLGKVKSAFWMAMATSRPEYANDNIRENFRKHFPTLMDRTCDAIAAITQIEALNNFLRYGEPVEQDVDQALFKYDHALVPAIRRKVGEAKWIDLDEPYWVSWKVEGKEREESEWRKRSKIAEYEGMLDQMTFRVRKPKSS